MWCTIYKELYEISSTKFCQYCCKLYLKRSADVATYTIFIRKVNTLNRGPRNMTFTDFDAFKLCCRVLIPKYAGERISQNGC